MSWTRATFKELLAQARADMGAQMGAVVYIRRTLEGALAYAGAALTHHLHGHLANNARNSIPDLADEDQFRKWANTFGLPQDGANKASGPITITGTGGSLLAGRQFSREPDGRLYTLDEDQTDIDSDRDVLVTAVVGGADGNLGAGATLSLVSPETGVESDATVTTDAEHGDGIEGGTDTETLLSWVLRFLERLQRSPRGGTDKDHEEWAKEVTDVTRAWAFKGYDGIGNPGAGRMAVTFVMDDPDTGDVTIPDSTKVAEVQAYLDDRSPMEVVVFAPTPVDYDFTATVVGATAAAVNAEVRDMLKREAIPGGTIYLSSLNEAISAADGETSHTVTSPTGDKAHSYGELAVYVAGTIT